MTDKQSSKASENNTEAAVDENYDPFSPENIGIIHFITQARIYDVLMALLTESNADLARNVLEAHAGGTLISTAPLFNGTFVTDEIQDADKNYE